ncbi:SH3 domain-containing protein [Oribacterium sp. WCC10]|uniref:SH3 domain-containing protein n=1 Tax=Oribacterium sp. WCC10 TaxID=1855343 RepID=UPI0008E8D1D3|nr:SH3 domain-containing protein [Oribacterium sp. WCC10]SFG15040.1 SH3 domain (SH3b1 type) [Oribacterium sp. WCC10]
MRIDSDSIKTGINRMFRGAAAAAVTVAILAVQPACTYAGVTYMPYVTAEMNTADYWLSLQGGNVDGVLADAAAIKRINADNCANAATNMNDLINYDKTIDTDNLNENLLKSSMEELKAYQSKGYYDQYGNNLTDELIESIAANTQSRMGTMSGAPMYGIVVKRTLQTAFPTTTIITDEQGDLNFDYNTLSAVRVNEPLIIKSVSADGLWYYTLSVNCYGWVKASDVAICASKVEWENAWNIPDNRVLVVTGNKIHLSESNTNPATSNLMLTMGTVLEMAPEGSYGARVTNRATIGNYVVYIPVRRSDGSYTKELALVSANADVNEGYLPLTTRNIITVAFNMLGETYGWGGMLSSNDCSGYVGDIYRCFGLVLPRNTTWQAASNAFGFDVTDCSDEQKAAILNNMPIGSVLFFKGHEMMYLGTVGGRYYVISAVSSIGYYAGPGVMRTRSVMINTLDTERANRTTWLRNIYKLQIPYMM